MKKIYLFLLLLVPILLPAQQKSRSTEHYPRPGDEIFKQEIGWFDSGEKGENILWDLSRVQVKETEYPVVYFMRDHHLASSEGRHLYTYQFSGDSLSLLIGENSSSVIRYHTPQLLMKYPIAYSSGFESAFSGKGKYGDRMEIRTEGETKGLVDGTGKLILPGGDTLYLVSRVHITKESEELYLPLVAGFDLSSPEYFPEVNEILDSSHIEIDAYLWYAEGYRYPVIESKEIRTQREGQPEKIERFAYLFHPEDQLSQLEEDQNATLRIEKEDPGEVISTSIADVTGLEQVRIYPNPVRDVLQVSMQSGESMNFQVSLYDLMGRVVYQSSKNVSPGEVVERVDMTTLAQGSYLLKIQAGEKSVREVIVKQ